MSKPEHTPRVGAPDPERRTSPIYTEASEDLLSLDLELETSGCFYNDTRYPIGQYVVADGELLHCEERGIWVKRGDYKP